MQNLKNVNDIMKVVCKPKVEETLQTKRKVTRKKEILFIWEII